MVAAVMVRRVAWAGLRRMRQDCCATHIQPPTTAMKAIAVTHC
jgi:hypothetical protein